MKRITVKHLEQLCEYLNELTGNPVKPWNEKGRANIGNYHLSYAYGGVCLHQNVNESGGVTTPIIHGHVAKRELFDLMHAYIKGIELHKELLKECYLLLVNPDSSGFEADSLEVKLCNVLKGRL